MLSLEDRLMNDPKFRLLVDTFFMYIRDAEFTPTEIREAAMLAQIKFESTQIRHILMDGLSTFNK